MQDPSLTKSLQSLLGKTITRAQHIYIEEANDACWLDNSVLFELADGEKYQFSVTQTGLQIIPIYTLKDLEIMGEWLPNARITTRPVPTIPLPQALHSITLHAVQPQAYVFMIHFAQEDPSAGFALVLGAFELAVVIDDAIIQDTLEGHRRAFVVETVRLH